MTLDRTVMPVAGPEPEFAPPVPSRGRVGSGLSVLAAERPNLPMVALALVLRAGSAADPGDVPGLTDLAASMLIEGTESRSREEVADEMERMGSSLRVSVSQDRTVIAAESLAPNWRDVLAVMADVARSPAFRDADLERVRTQRLTDLARITDDPGAVARRALGALLYGHGTPYGHPGSGTEASIGSIGRADLAAHHARSLGPQGAALVAAGQVTAEEVADAAGRLLGDWRPQHSPDRTGPGSPGPGAGAERVIHLADRPGAAQSVIRSGQTLVPRHHPDHAPLVVLNQVLGGEFSARLNMNLREDKGYSYGYMSAIDWRWGPSSLVAGGSVQTEVTGPAVAESLREWSEIRTDRPVEPSEHDDAVLGLLRGYPSSFETQGQIAGRLVRMACFDLPDDHLSRLPEEIRSVSTQDVRRVADQHLRPAPEVIVVVGDREQVEPGLAELGMPIVPIDSDGRMLS